MTDMIVTRTTLEAGGGDFFLPCLTLGVFLCDQRTHRLALGTDRRSHLPLSRHAGWLLPAGSTGICEYDEPLDVVTIAFDTHVLEEVGLVRPDLVAPNVGSFDPLTLQLALNAEAFSTAGTLYRQTMMHAFAAHLAQSLGPASAGRIPLDDRRLARAVDYIHDNLDKDLSLHDLASAATLSPYHFARAFKAATGSSPLQYVIAARIDLAKALLTTTRLSVTDVAYRVGYADPGRFGRHFKKRVGVSPGAFRRR